MLIYEVVCGMYDVVVENLSLSHITPMPPHPQIILRFVFSLYSLARAWGFTSTLVQVKISLVRFVNHFFCTSFVQNNLFYVHYMVILQTLYFTKKKLLLYINIVSTNRICFCRPSLVLCFRYVFTICCYLLYMYILRLNQMCVWSLESKVLIGHGCHLK